MTVAPPPDAGKGDGAKPAKDESGDGVPVESVATADTGRVTKKD
jgi:hypothetical protein